jgi:hypothetical protein
MLAVVKGHGGTGIRARVKQITTAYADHYTIPPVLTQRTDVFDHEINACDKKQKV